MRLYVENFIYTTTEAEMKKLFAAHDFVINARIVNDQYTRQSKCFGHVTMLYKKDGRRAIDAFHGSNMNNHELVVKQAKPI